jgi:hypothetical protein
MVVKLETLPNNLNERRFRGYWEKTDKSLLAQPAAVSWKARSLNEVKGIQLGMDVPA